MTPAFDLTDQNYFKWSYDLVDWETAPAPGASLTLSWSKARRGVGPLREEALKAADLVRRQALSFNRPIHMYLSGGLDSEIAMRCLLETGAKVTPVIICFENGYNDHDTQYAFRYCETVGVMPVVQKINVERMWDTVFPAYMDEFMQPRLHFIPLMWTIDQMKDGFPVVGNGDPEFERKPDDKNQYRWHYYYRERYLNVPKFLLKRDRPGVADFWSYTPELLLSWFQSSEIKDLVFAKHRPYKDYDDAKRALYYHMWPEAEKRPKYAGYEVFFKGGYANNDPETQALIRKMEGLRDHYSRIHSSRDTTRHYLYRAITAGLAR